MILFYQKDLRKIIWRMNINRHTINNSHSIIFKIYAKDILKSIIGPEEAYKKKSSLKSFHLCYSDRPCWVL